MTYHTLKVGDRVTRTEIKKGSAFYDHVQKGYANIFTIVAVSGPRNIKIWKGDDTAPLGGWWHGDKFELICAAPAHEAEPDYKTLYLELVKQHKEMYEDYLERTT